MKKIIESELISIAHRILKMKDKSDVQSLYTETQKLHEKLMVLKFYEDNKFRLDPTLTEEKLADAFKEPKEPEDKQLVTDLDFSGKADLEKERIREVINEAGKEAIQENKPDYMSSDIVKELLNETESNKIMSLEEDDGGDENFEIIPAAHNEVEEEVDFAEEAFIENTYQESVLEIDPVFNVSFDEIEFEQKVANPVTVTTEPNAPVPETNIDEIAPVVYDKTGSEQKNKAQNIENQHFLSTRSTSEDQLPFHKIPLNKTINDAFSKTITIGLNDRIAFEKNLFNNSSEDLNRVISQLNTIETFQEAQDFIEDLVKPDFNYWKGKDEYASRFMHLIEKRFL